MKTLAGLFTASLLLATTSAFAQQVDVQIQGQYTPQQPVYVQQPYQPYQQQPQQPVYQTPPPPPYAQAGQGQYVAPMQQQYQQTYVPQSVGMSGPRILRDWHEGEPIPPGYHPTTRARSGLIAGGITMFAVPYLVSVLVGAGNADTGSDNALYIPVLGPFIQMGNEKQNAGNCSTYSGFTSCYGGYSASSVALADVALAVDGVLQTVGAVMFIVGIAVPKTVLVRNDLGAVKNLHVTPMVGKNMTGLGVAAQF
jgi:hypothetical protein